MRDYWDIIKEEYIDGISFAICIEFTEETERSAVKLCAVTD